MVVILPSFIQLSTTVLDGEVHSNAKMYQLRTRTVSMQMAVWITAYKYTYICAYICIY